MILWGPPGCGKTTLAELIAKKNGTQCFRMSAVSAGVKEIKQIASQAKGKTIVFIDEIHRLNKAQQDVLLPLVENGTFVLIGATTENPSFEVNSALLSRCRVFVLNALDVADIVMIIKRALADCER